MMREGGRRRRDGAWLGRALATVAVIVGAAGCAASAARPAAPCSGTHVMAGANGQCVPCGAAGQACCPDEDPNAGPPNGDYCWAEGTDCLPADPPNGLTSCVPCGHVGERACASGCVQGFPEPSPDGGAQRCSCNVPDGMPALPGCPATPAQ